MVERLPGALLRVEGVALAAGAVALYLHADLSLVAFFALFLAPDLSFLGYAAGPRVGAAAYDVAHTELWPIALAVVGVLADAEVATQLGLIWLAHIGFDRALGYGLKYPTAFGDTHLGRV